MLKNIFVGANAANLHKQRVCVDAALKSYLSGPCKLQN